jgi:hypothetical protein
VLNRKRESLFGLSMPTKKRKTKLKLSAFLYFVDTDEKATDKLLFPIYPQILLTSKCSKYKYSILLILKEAYKSTQKIPKWKTV